MFVLSAVPHHLRNLCGSLRHSVLDYTHQFLINFEFNGYLAVNDSPQAPHPGPVRMADIENPSQVLLFEDYSNTGSYHASFRNFALSDGSAKAFPSSQQSAPSCHGKWWT